MCVSDDKTLSLLGVTDATRTPNIKYYIKGIFRVSLTPDRAIFAMSA